MDVNDRYLKIIDRQKKNLSLIDELTNDDITWHCISQIELEIFNLQYDLIPELLASHDRYLHFIGSLSHDYTEEQVTEDRITYHKLWKNGEYQTDICAIFMKKVSGISIAQCYGYTMFRQAQLLRGNMIGD